MPFTLARLARLTQDDNFLSGKSGFSTCVVTRRARQSP
jgi:hypothetical protein